VRPVEKLLLSGGDHALAAVLRLPLPRLELEPRQLLERYAEIEQSRASQLVLEEVLDPRLEGVAADLEPSAVDFERVLVLRDLLERDRVLVERVRVAELETGLDLNQVLPVGGLDLETLASVTDSRAAPLERVGLGRDGVGGGRFRRFLAGRSVR
jgi:hypothetical protein